MREASIEEIKQRLQGASRIGLLVHGIGDHHAVEILKQAEQGFRSLDSVAAAEAERLGFSALLPEKAKGFSAEALILNAGGTSYVLISLVWSESLNRLLREDGVSVPLLLRMAFELPVTLFYCLKLPFQCGTLSWAAVSLIAGLLIWLFSATTLLCLSAALGAFFFARETFAGSSDIKMQFPLPAPIAAEFERNPWLVFVLLGFLTIALLTLGYVSKGFHDYLHDVLLYLGSPYHRGNLLNTISRVVESIDASRGSATLVVAGHSLGSVLITHALLDVELSGSPLFLATFGSPIHALSRIFSRRVMAPADLIDRLARKRVLGHWVNAYRDADFVGRWLGIPASDYFSEFSLGQGGHGGYFGDPELWRRFAMLLRGAGADMRRVASEHFRVHSLTPAEIEEVRQYQRSLTFAPFLAIAFIALGWIDLRGYVVNIDIAALPLTWCTQAFSLVIAALCFAICVAGWISCWLAGRRWRRRYLLLNLALAPLRIEWWISSHRASDRLVLCEFRLWQPWLRLGLAGTQIALVLACAAQLTTILRYLVF